MSNFRRWSLAAVCAALLGAGAAFAASGDRFDEGIDLQRSAMLTPRAAVAQSAEYLKKIRDVRSRIEKLRDKAKKDKDVVKLNCVDDKLRQVNGHLLIADKSNASLNAAVASGDQGAREHQFTRVTILYQKVNILGTEAEQCIGEDVSYVGATRVDVEIDPSIPPYDPTQPELPLPNVDRPPEASPFV